MKAFNCLLKCVREGGYLLGLGQGGEMVKGEEVSHLLSANDTLVFVRLIRSNGLFKLVSDVV